jgi:hypothetical protein
MAVLRAVSADCNEQAELLAGEITKARHQWRNVLIYAAQILTIQLPTACPLWATKRTFQRCYGMSQKCQ